MASFTIFSKIDIHTPPPRSCLRLLPKNGRHGANSPQALSFLASPPRTHGSSGTSPYTWGLQPETKTPGDRQEQTVDVTRQGGSSRRGERGLRNDPRKGRDRKRSTASSMKGTRR